MRRFYEYPQSMFWRKNKKEKYMKIEGEARDVTQTRPCIMQKFLKVVKRIFFRRKKLIFFLILLKTLIAGTR